MAAVNFHLLYPNNNFFRKFFLQFSSPTKGFHRQLSSHDALHRSNSSLELMHDPYHHNETLRREYGSHGSIDVIGNGKDNRIK